MSVSRRHLAEVIAERTLHLHDTKLLAKEIAAYLLTEYRTADFESLMRDIIDYRAKRGLVEATAISAHKLSDHVLLEIKSVLKQEYPHAKRLELHQAIDPNVIGGLKLELANEQLDLTVRAKLAKFKRLTAHGKGIS